MDHATKFSHRHSLNGREAAAHIQGQTEHYMSSARLIRSEMHAGEVIAQEICPCLCYSDLYRHSFQKQKELQPGLKLEDEGNSSLMLQCSKLKPFNLTNRWSTAWSPTGNQLVITNQ